MTLHPLTGEVISEEDEVYIGAATHYVTAPERMERAITCDRGRAGGTAGRAGARWAAAGGAAAADAYDVRHRDDAPDRHVFRDRELLPAHRRTRGRYGAALPAGLLPRGLPAGHRRVARDRPADRRDVRGRHVPQADPGRARLPAAVGDGQPAAALGGVPGADRPDRLPVRDPGAVRAGQVRRVRRADHPADRSGRPRGDRQADQGPDRRPDPRDPAPGRARRAGPGHDADQEDVRGPDRLPAGDGDPDQVSAQRGRHAPPGRAAPRAADGRVRRSGRHQPAP